MIQKLLFGICLLVFAAARAEDLESLLGSGSGSTSKTASSTQQNLMVDTLKPMIGAKHTAEQNVFFRYLELSQWDKALIQFPSAIAGTSFERSSNAQALHSLLYFKNGMVVTGLEQLFSIREPKKINVYLLSQWKEAAGETHPVWKVALLDWNEAWTEVFGLGFEVKSKTNQISYKKGLSTLKELAKRASTDSPERSLVEWHLALAYSLNDQPTEAAKVMAGLLKTQNAPVSQDLLNLNAARLLYQNGYFDAAIKYDLKVAKGSDYWLDAQEEAAWAFIRKGEPQNAMAITKTLTQPVFKGQVGPETHFVQALAQLKVCDYPGVVKGLKDFPVLFKTRTMALKKLAADSNNPAVTKILSDLKTRDLRWEDLGAEAQYLPRMLHRDQKLRNFARAQALLEAEGKVAEDLYSKSLGQTGLQSVFEKRKNSLMDRAQMAKVATLNRVQEMAKLEVEETEKILAKMQIIEAEVIQQVSMSSKLAKTKTGVEDVKTGTTGSMAQDTLKFRVTSDEVWFDELSNYQINVKKACQRKKE